MKKRALIAAGGTGGHFYPGLALALELQARGWEVVFSLRKDDICQPLLDERGIPSFQLDVAGFPRSVNPLRQMAFIWKTVSALLTAKRVIKDWRPDIVVGTGGYICFPAVLAGSFGGSKTLIHDSNATLGLASKALLPFVDRIALGLPVAKLRGNPKAIITGTPVRPQFAKSLSRAEAEAELGFLHFGKRVLLFGGSQGAKRLNAAAAKVFSSLAAESTDTHFVLVTGKANFETISAQCAKAPNLTVLPYCENMNAAMRASDLLAARSGAGTVTELSIVKTPALLIPLPLAENHQQKNADALASCGAAKILLATPSIERDLETALRSLLSDGKILKDMAAAYGRLDLPDALSAAQKLADTAQELISR